MSDCVLEVKNISKSFGKLKILDDISLTVRRGEVWGLAGPNGAGKTTFLRVVCGLMRPDGGSVSVLSKKAFTGYMPQSCRFGEKERVLGILRFFAAIKKTDYCESLALCERLRLDPGKKARHLSPGQQKKLQIVLAMAGCPELFILDEPTAGLDPEAVYEITGILKSLRSAGKSMIISSHILGDLDELCTHAAMLEHGRLTCCKKLDGRSVIEVSPIPVLLLSALKARYTLEYDASHTRLTAEAADVPALVRELSANGVEVYGVSAENVKSIFLKQMQSSAKEA